MISGDVLNNSDNTEPVFMVDTNRNSVVFIDEKGLETVIQSVEESGLVSCTEVIDFALLDVSDSSSRHVGDFENQPRAYVLGRRSDGRFGLWILFRGGRVVSVEDLGGLENPELQELVNGKQPLSKYFGWEYKTTNILASEGGREAIIIGYAENQGYSRHRFTIEKGTKIGVYWTLTEKHNGLFHISRAKVIGINDNNWWKYFRQNSTRSNYRHNFNWKWILRLLFNGWYDRFLTEPERIEFGDADGEYKIYGNDQDNESALAIVNAAKVLSIEKYTEEPSSEPPNVIIGPMNAITINKDVTQPVLINLEVDGELDPDDPIVFKYEVITNQYDIPLVEPVFSFDEENGIISFTYDISYKGQSVEIDFWTERGVLVSSPYRITFTFKQIWL